MKIKIERIQKEKMSKRKRADNFSGQASKNGACPLAFTVM